MPHASRAARPDLVRVQVAVAVIVLAGVAGLVEPLAGAVADALLVAWFALASRRWPAATGLLLVPALRILWIAIPARGVAAIHWLPLAAIPFLVLTVLVAWSAGVRPGLAGLRPGRWDVLLVVVSGWAVAGAAIALLAGDAVAWGRTGGTVAWLLVLLYAPLVAVAEELALRGVLPWTLMRAGPADAVTLAAVAAACLALGAASPWWAVIAVATAAVNALVARRTGSIVGAIAGHAVFLVVINL